MATVTLNRLIELVARATGFYTEGTASGTHSVTTLQDSSADSEIDALPTSNLTGKWLRITDTTDDLAPIDEARKISSVSTSTLTVDTAFSAAPADGDTYEVLTFHPSTYIDAIQESIRTLFPTLYVGLINETLVLDNLVSNFGFETFTVANTPDNWTLTNLSAGTTITKDTARVFHGTSSIKCAPSGADGTVSQDLFNVIEVHEMAGKTLHFHPRAWYDGSSTVKARVSFDNGSTFTDSSSHSGSSEWQRLSIDVTIPTTATTAIVYCFTTDGETAYWDFAPGWVGPIPKYTIPSTFIHGPHQVLIQADADNATRFLPLTSVGQARSGRLLRLEGKGRLTVPTSGTATTEVDETQAELIAENAAAYLFRRLARTDPGNRDQHMEDARIHENRAEMLKVTPGVRSPRKAASVPPLGVWKVTADADGRYLMVSR